MSWDDMRKKLEEMAGNTSAYGTEELQAALQNAAQCEEQPEDDAWVQKYIGPIQSEFQNRGINSSTFVRLQNEAYDSNQSDVYVEAVLQWASTRISKCLLHSGDSKNLDCEYVWYDLYVYDASSSALLAKKIGIYGDSAWRFVNKGHGYEIVK